MTSFGAFSPLMDPICWKIYALKEKEEVVYMAFLWEEYCFVLLQGEYKSLGKDSCTILHKIQL